MARNVDSNLAPERDRPEAEIRKQLPARGQMRPRRGFLIGILVIVLVPNAVAETGQRTPGKLFEECATTSLIDTVLGIRRSTKSCNSGRKLCRDFSGAAIRRDTIDLITILAIIVAISAWI